MRHPLLLPVVMILVVAATPGPAAPSVRPGTLLVYYGWPSQINGSLSVSAAAHEFGRYGYVVWGDTLEDPAHPDHSNAVQIIADPAAASTRFYGYVDLGVNTQNLPMSEVETRIAQWRGMGVAGVLLDNSGYDLGTPRARQNTAVDYAHAQGLAVVVDAFRPEDAFGSAPVPLYNPQGTPTHLGSADFYLYESHGVRLGEYEDAAVWQAKADTVEAYRASLGFGVLSITTTANDNVAAYDEHHFFYAWYAALLYGHLATGWGEFAFSAAGASTSQAPFRARPTLDPGSAFLGPVVHSGPYHYRPTDLGRIELNTDTHAYGFNSNALGVSTPTGSAAMKLTIAPNPVRDAATLEFVLPSEQAVRLTVRDVSGRSVATLMSETLPAGRQRLAWDSRDEAGTRVPAGVYFVTLECAGALSVARVAVVR